MLVVLAAGCATKDKPPLVSRDKSIVLLNPELELSEHWQHRRLKKADTTYTRVESDLGHTIMAQGNVSASILFRDFEPIDMNCSLLRWSGTSPGRSLALTCISKAGTMLPRPFLLCLGMPESSLTNRFPR